MVEKIEDVGVGLAKYEVDGKTLLLSTAEIGEVSKLFDIGQKVSAAGEDFSKFPTGLVEDMIKLVAANLKRNNPTEEEKGLERLATRNFMLLIEPICNLSGLTQETKIDKIEAMRRRVAEAKTVS